jgi:hypothetical protein
MGLDQDSVMIIHMGGVYGDKPAALERFRKVYTEQLSERVKQRLVLENDEVSRPTIRPDRPNFQSVVLQPGRLVADQSHVEYSNSGTCSFVTKGYWVEQTNRSITITTGLM